VPRTAYALESRRRRTGTAREYNLIDFAYVYSQLQGTGGNYAGKLSRGEAGFNRAPHVFRERTMVGKGNGFAEAFV
jgi:hypothetical protein